MASRTGWSVVLGLSMVWIIGGFLYTLSLTSGGPLPFLLVVPAVILARVAWRHLRRA